MSIPVAHDLLFERFLHEDHQGTPDIDIDFSTDHREQVLQYVYEKYGPDRTGMVANVVTFRPRMAIRQVGAAMGFPETVIDKLGTHTDSWYLADVESTLASAARHRRYVPTTHGSSSSTVLRRIEGTPRHLSIHVGGMLVTGEPLVDVVPVERATMPGRVVVQFDKDDVEDLGLIKMDLLGLRTLSAIAECLDLIEQTTGQRPDLDALSLDDQRVYDVICKVDTIGLFQIEFARPAAIALAVAAALLQRSDRAGGDHPPRPDPGRCGPSLPPPPPGARAGDLSASQVRADSG